MKLRITIDDKPYEVEVEFDETETPTPYAPATVIPSMVVPQAAAAPAAAPSPNGAAEDKVCRSPMVGIIVRINVREGQHVEKDDPLLVLEAMKMETTITSPINGTVKAIPVSASESVQGGQVLVEFE